MQMHVQRPHVRHHDYAMTETPRYATLRDYLRVIRTNRLVILLVTLTFAAAGLGISLLQQKVYSAQAEVSFQDASADLSLLGSNATAGVPASLLASMNASLVNRPEVNRMVQQQLDSPLSPGALGSKVSAQVSVTTNLVGVRATDTNPVQAAVIANAYARTVAELANRAVHRRLGIAIKHESRAAGRAGKVLSFAEQQAQAQVNQLKTAQAIVHPAQVVEKAQVPTIPSGPLTKRNTVLGGLVGLVFGLAIAFVRDALDRRLRGPSDVHEETGLPVLGRIADDALGASIAGKNGGKAFKDADFEAFRILRANIEFLRVDAPLRTILITSGLPEEGKSTVALALASAMAGAGRRTLLVECDLRRPSLSGRLGIQRSPGLSDYLVGNAAPGDILQQVQLSFGRGSNGSDAASGADNPTLVCIAAGAQVPQPGELLGSLRFREFLGQVSRAYDSVILDTSPLLSVVDGLELVPQVDGVLVCVRLSQTTRQEARAARDVLDKLPERPTGVVVTGLKSREEGYGYYYRAYGQS